MYGTGRIGEIIAYLEQKHGCKIAEISADLKLSALCESMQISRGSFDRLIAENPPVLRTVKGHAFESFFDTLVRSNGFEIIEVGGDEAIDRIVNKHTLQLKTYTESGTKGNFVQYKTHKTHGAKSELESMDYYHRVAHFADYLVGLVSYNPLRILVLAKQEIPRHILSADHLLSPFSIDWTTHPGLNAFDRLGLKLVNLSAALPLHGGECLPLTSQRIGISSDIILNTILNEANFRIWDMAIRGFSREVMFLENLSSFSIPAYKPSDLRRDRADKADHAVKISAANRFIQMKGVSTNSCRFNLEDPIISTETQLTRGRVNDHPTQSRLYLRTDFDYLVLGMDPPVVNLCRSAANLGGGLEWEFYMIPSSALQSHHILTNRFKPMQTFRYSELQQYKIVDWNRSFA